MRDVAAMRKRIAILKRQAEAFRKLGVNSHDPALGNQFSELSDRCDAIAANIERNLPIHEKSR